jgi:hypothetical protein
MLSKLLPRASLRESGKTFRREVAKNARGFAIHVLPNEKFTSKHVEVLNSHGNKK